MPSDRDRGCGVEKKLDKKIRYYKIKIILNYKKKI